MAERRVITFWFIGPLFMLREQRLLTVRSRADGSEYVMARERESHKYIRVTLDDATTVCVTPYQQV